MMDRHELEKALTPLTKAVRAIAHGTVDGPGGLEALAMAISGTNLAEPLAPAVRDAGESIGDGLRAIAAAIESK